MIPYPRMIGIGIAILGLTMADDAPANEAQRTVARQLNEANQFLRNGDVDAALEAYERVQRQGPPSPELSYNLAVAHYRQGDIAAAEQLFRKAAAAEDDALAAKSRYNLGNCNCAAAVHVAGQNPGQAIEHLRAAIAHYRSALAIDPMDDDARANIELATRLIEKLQDQQEQKKKEQQQRQQDDQRQQDQQDQQQRQQQDQQQQDQGQQQEGSSDSESESGEEPSPANDSRAGEQQSQQSEEDSSAAQEADQQPPDDDAGKPREQPRRQAESSNQGPEGEEPASAEDQTREQGQAPPEGELTTAGEEDEPPAERKEQGVAAFDPSQDGSMTAQEAQKMLQAIRDRDLLRRLRRQAAERERHIPVERDW